MLPFYCTQTAVLFLVKIIFHPFNTAYFQKVMVYVFELLVLLHFLTFDNVLLFAYLFYDRTFE